MPSKCITSNYTRARKANQAKEVHSYKYFMDRKSCSLKRNDGKKFTFTSGMYMKTIGGNNFVIEGFHVAEYNNVPCAHGEGKSVSLAHQLDIL